jgi:hypothetical protein
MLQIYKQTAEINRTGSNILRKMPNSFAGWGFFSFFLREIDVVVLREGGCG